MVYKNFKFDIMIKGFIYCITNTINGKKYVGKTTLTVEKRWLEHKRDFLKLNEIRPLYRAFKKYGVENFEVSQLEECSVELLSERESYWIAELKTFTLGYNATLGGDGSILYDYENIIEVYKQGGTIKETSEIIGCCTDTVSAVLKNNNIEKNPMKINYDIINKPKSVKQYSLVNEYLRTFDSVTEASKWLLENNYIKKLQSGVRSHISDCARGKQRTAYKFIWKYE